MFDGDKVFEFRSVDKSRISALLFLLAVISSLHFFTGTSTNIEHVFHVSLRLAYFIPLILGALWYGLRGAAWMSVACCLLLSTHLFLFWPTDLSEIINHLVIIILFPFMGISVGILVDREEAARQHRAHEAELAARQAMIESLASLSAALDAKDSYSLKHSNEVAMLAVKVGVELKLPEETLDLLHMAGAVHDIGKIGVRDDVLFKNSQISNADREHIKRHPEIAAAILRPISGVSRIAEVVLCHHEYIDGSGYPRGIKGDDIPLEARILTVVDIYSALIDKRPYKSPQGSEEALQVLRSMSGVKLDARVVQALHNILENPGSLDMPA